MDTHIIFDDQPTEEDSYCLNQLATLITDECNLPVRIEKDQIKQGVRDSGLVIGLTIASLALTAIQTLIASLQYWESHNPKYSFSIKIGNQTLRLRGFSKSQVDEVIRLMQITSPETNIEIRILKKG
jgi:hypothetical protein